MPRKSAPKKKPKLTDAERHACFVETARQIEASEKPKDFDKAFKRVASSSGATAERANRGKPS